MSPFSAHPWLTLAATTAASLALLAAARWLWTHDKDRTT